MTLKLYSNDAGSATPSPVPADQSAVIETGQNHAATQAESLGYLSDMVAELKEMAARAGFTRLERLLNVALQEAIEDRAQLLEPTK